jgi:FkbM family methyltransferase
LIIGVALENIEIPFLEYEDNLNSFGTNNDNMYSNGEFVIAQKFIKKNNIVFDIGANHGNWTKMVLSIAPLKMIYCVEPIQDLCKYLTTQFHFRNDLKIAWGAISDKLDNVDFYIYKNNPQIAEMSNMFGRPEIEIKMGLDIEKIKVKTLTIDHLCKNEKINKVNYIKIDTEGAELLALRGSIETLKRNMIDFIQFEYGGCFKDSKATLKETFQLLGSYNFTIFRILPNGLMHFNYWKDEMENYLHSNYLAIHNCDLPITKIN